MKNNYIGFGFDIHVFSKKKKPLVLGGYTVPGAPGLEAVSDGDVVLHAVCDALLGAAALGDIGDMFPPEDKKSRGIDSKKIAAAVLKKLGKKIEVVNIDVTIIAQKPRLVAHKPAITASLKNIFGARVNVKIKSKENLDILGGVNAMACMVVAGIERCK